MATTKTKKYMPEVKATGKGTVSGAIIGTLIKKGVLDKEKTRTRAKQYRKLTGKGLSDGQAISKIKLYESLPIKPKKEEGGPVATSHRLTRLGNKIARKTNAGKTVSEGLQKRYDKAADKVIIKQLKKSTKEKAKTKMSRGGSAVKKMNMGGPGDGTTVPVGTVVNDGRVWNGKGYDPAPAGTPAVTPKTPVNQTPVATPGTVMNDGRVWDGKRYVRLKTGGAKMAKGGMTKAKKFAALAPPYNKATAADRIAGAKKNKRK